MLVNLDYMSTPPCPSFSWPWLLELAWQAGTSWDFSCFPLSGIAVVILVCLTHGSSVSAGVLVGSREE